MAVVVLARMKVDPASFKKVHDARSDDFRAVMAQAQKAGVLHHRFILGDGEVVIIDDWPSAEAFQKFFDNATVASLMQDAGVEGPPEISFYESIETVDQL